MHKEVTFILPTIPRPPEGEVTVLMASEDYVGKGPFFSGDGPINLRCGRCMYLLVYHFHSGQLVNLVLKCPNSKCGAYNAIISVPVVEDLIGQLQKTSPMVVGQLSDLTQMLEHAQKKRLPKEQLFSGIRQYMPDFAWIEKMVVPENSGDFYSLLGFLVPLIGWYLKNKPLRKKRPRSVANDFLQANK